MKVVSLSLVLASALQCWRMWVMSSKVLQAEDDRQKPFGLLLQWLQRPSVLYLPDNISDCTDAMDTRVGEDPAVVQRGCGEERDMYFG